MYQALPITEPLSQGDVIDGCPIFALDPVSTEIGAAAAPARWDMRVIVLTQACDLVQEKTTRVLVALVHSAESLVKQGALKGSTIRDQVRRGQVYGWYFLPAAPASIGVPESIIDFHDLHTVPRGVLTRLIEQDRRVCRIVTPYREHLAQHFAVTYSRIGLPEPYETQP